MLLLLKWEKIFYIAVLNDCIINNLFYDFIR